jgi:serine/threonine protein kinase
LTRRIGSGGAGDVFLAEGPAHGGAAGIAAVKVLRGEASDSTAIAIVRQVQAVAELHQAHVLPIYGAGEDGPTVYIAMAYAPGGSLGTTIATDHGIQVRLPLGAGVVARLVNQVARALQTLHQQGAVHGDLKPSNLFVRTAANGGPIAAVADFGQTIVMRAATKAATTGTAWAAEALRCAAPEQLHGEDLPASDQYALATIAYLLLTGRYPFTADAPHLADAILHTAPVSPARWHPGLGPRAEAALLRALAKTPAARFPDIATFARALDDGLAASQSAVSDITQEFSALAGGALTTNPARPTASPPHTTPRDAAGSATGSSQHQPPVQPASPNGWSGAARPAGSPRAPSTARPAGLTGQGPRQEGAVTMRRRGLTPRQRLLALVMGLVIVGLAIGGGLGLTSLLSGVGPEGRLPNFGGLNYAPTVTANANAAAKAAAMAQVAQSRLASVLAARPVFGDSLSANTQHWPVDNKNSFFGADGRLHLYNHDANAVLSVNQPVDAPTNYAVSVNLAFLHGGASDLAGLRLRVTPVDNGHYAHYTVLISPDGRYEIWRYDGARWTVLDFGYTQAIQRGLGQSNTLTVLAERGALWIFVNQRFISTVADAGGSAQSATTMGPTVAYAGTEVGFSHYAVYPDGA